MNKKKLDFIESGMKLFAIKGYYHTTIDEIATKAGVSKGSFYLYFQSKEEFLGIAYDHFYTQMINLIEKVEKEDLAPKENLAKQITVIAEYIYDYKNFIIMQIRDNVSVGKEFGKLVEKATAYNFNWLKNHIQAIYDDDVDEYLIDTVIQLDGLLNGYYKWMVVDGIEINKKKTGNFIVKRLDDIVVGMLKGNEGPLIGEDHLPINYQLSSSKEQQEQEAINTLFLIKEKISTLSTDIEKIKRLHEVVHTMLKEIGKVERQQIVIQGLLVHFQHIPALREKCEHLATLLQIELLILD